MPKAETKPSKYSVMVGSLTILNDLIEVGLWEDGRPNTCKYYRCSLKALTRHPDTDIKAPIARSLAHQRDLLEENGTSVLTEVVV